MIQNKSSEVAMGKKMKLSNMKLISCFLMLFILSGCIGAREINDLEIVIGMGVDKDENPENILLTAQVVKATAGKASENESRGEDSKAFWNVSSRGNSVFDAVRQITHKTGNRLFISHNQAVIFGKDIAKEGLQEYIDFFLRAHEMRPTALILIAEDRASDVLNAKPETEKFPAVNIAKLIKTYGFTSNFYKVNMEDFASCLLNPTKAQLVPLVSIIQDGEYKDVYVSGMVVFKKGKMVSKLTHDDVRGLLWILGKVKSGVIIVPSPNEQGKAVLEIIKAKSKVTPEIKDGKIVMHIKIREESSLSEQTTSENLATNEAFEKIQEASAEVIRKEAMAAFNKSVELNADIFGFGEMLHKKYSKEWKTLKDNWDEIYPTIELNIDVETKIIKTDLLKKPASPSE
ncbi:Ger(x)C family spore germination protein [Acetivibrio mesophilus]|uniref:Ger(X)C family spore germination protein n=2 Tax=Acetivibrio mesophilus TaxID=2487273 RepID=A0A4Q0I0C6_9FIRM|nr:Ger(x)C family spore germination protein [Acetivibrio mesophilus]